MIRLMQEKDCLGVAKIHKEALEGDYLPTLGLNILKIIYEGLLKDRKSFGYVSEENEEIMGFVTGSENTDNLFKEIIKKKFVQLFYYTLLSVIKKPSLARGIIQTFKYNKKVKTGTSAEMISLAIKKEYRNRGLGKELIDKAISNFKKRGISKIKLSVNRSNLNANGFYQKTGWEYVRTFDIYNKEMNIYILKI